MHVVVCVKQVPDWDIPPSSFKIDEGTNKVVPPAGVAPVPSQFDGIGVEAAMRLKDKQPDAKITIKQLFGRINKMLDEDMVVVADVGDSLFAAADLTIYRHTEFISPAYYTSMGFAIPAAIGVQVANPKLRPIVLVGDGAFQMTCLELSTAVKFGFNPLVLVLNNKGYTTERFLQEGPFNDIPNWNYHRLPDLLGDGWGFEVYTEGDLDQALNAALANQDTFSLLNIHLEPTDISPALNRLAKRMSKSI